MPYNPHGHQVSLECSQRRKSVSTMVELIGPLEAMFIFEILPHHNKKARPLLLALCSRLSVRQLAPGLRNFRSVLPGITNVNGKPP
jgi:hypothetical protein